MDSNAPTSLHTDVLLEKRTDPSRQIFAWILCGVTSFPHTHHLAFHLSHNSTLLSISSTKQLNMKLAIASLLVGSAAAFAPAASFGVRNTALNMATETAEKVSVVRSGL